MCCARNRPRHRLPRELGEVIATDVGGGLVKSHVFPEELLTAALAKDRRPVEWIEDRASI